MEIFVRLELTEIFQSSGRPVAELSTMTRIAGGKIEGGVPRRPGAQAHVQFLGREGEAKETMIIM